MRYPKKYTVKEWNRFSLEMQERLCKRYNVFLTDHTSKSEKINGMLDKITIKNINKAVGMVSKGIEDFSKTMSKMDFGMDKRDYDILIGKSEKLPVSAP